jgi:hypothetical protein
LGEKFFSAHNHGHMGYNNKTKEDELMDHEPLKEYEQILALALRLDKSAQLNLIAALTPRHDQSPAPKLGDNQPKLSDILAKAHESLSGLNKDQYWAERERELAASRASWEALEEGSWRG